jgi:hypothetical protein
MNPMDACQGCEDLLAVLSFVCVVVTVALYLSNAFS